MHGVYGNTAHKECMWVERGKVTITLSQVTFAQIRVVSLEKSLVATSLPWFARW